MKIKHSSGDDKHPYLKTKFWMENRFWERPDVPQHVKDYYNEWLENMVKNERREYVLK